MGVPEHGVTSNSGGKGTVVGATEKADVGGTEVSDKAIRGSGGSNVTNNSGSINTVSGSFVLYPEDDQLAVDGLVIRAANILVIRIGATDRFGANDFGIDLTKELGERANGIVVALGSDIGIGTAEDTNENHSSDG